MKCELCHQAEAETAITLTVDGQEKELYVCAACARDAANPAPRRKKAPPRGRGTPKVTIVGGNADDVPQPLVEEFVKATLGFMKGMAESEEAPNRTCPSCRRTWESVKESGRLGCPTCWKAFAREIREEFLRAEYGRAHLGAAPSVDALPDTRDMRAVLERDLKAAIAREDYRLAAELKHKLDALPRNKPGGKPADGKEDA